MPQGVKKWLPKQFGAEPKKVALLGGLVVVFLIVYWISRAPSPDPSAAVTPVKTVVESPALKSLPERDTSPMPPKRTPTPRSGGSTSRAVLDFRPSLKLKEDVDVSTIDPTLRLDLLAKVREVPMEGGSRSLFEFAQPPAPPPPKVDPIKVSPSVAAPPTTPPKPVEPVKPAPPPIPLKFYGLAGTTRDGIRRACFLDGDVNTGEIFLAAENELVKSRYKVVRIGVNSVVVEDTSNKNQQTLPLVEEVQ